jgi:hypothetical protein
MAISTVDCVVFRELSRSKAFPAHPDVLELGEANWYGDVTIEQLVADIQEFADADSRLELLRQLESLLMQPSSSRFHFDVAKIFYRTFLGYRTITAIDLHGTEQALRLDLNLPVPIDGQFHVVMNSGTAEHVFNICQFFKTTHEKTRPGGLMIHALPFTGWLDHGFFNFNPTFVADLAAANQYQPLIWLHAESQPLRLIQIQSIAQVHEMGKRGELGTNSLHYVVLRKPQENRPFVVPMQGIYSGNVSAQAKEDWMKMR